MALLRQSQTWPVHSVRDLHSKAQLSYLWQLDLPDENDSTDRDMMFLAQRMSFPGIEIDRQKYSVGGQEHYHLGASRRGGIISATFLEIEGGKVDKFFRDWFNLVDAISQEIVVESHFRSPKGKGYTKGGGHSRSGFVKQLTRLGTVSVEWALLGILPLRIGRYELAYEGSGALLLPVEMTCDEVRRVE